jgi:hypothetical protein
LTRATRVGIAAAGVLLAVLAASGAWLWWEYRPDRDQWVRTLHQVSAIALLAVAVVLVALAVLRRGTSGAPGIVAGVGVLVTVGGAYVLGRLLPWDGLALGAVRSANDVPSGVAATFHDRVRIVVIDGREVSPSTYHWWAIAHLALAALVVVALVLLWLRTRDRGVSRPRPAPAPAVPPER